MSTEPRRSTRTRKPTARYQLLLESARKRAQAAPASRQSSDSDWVDVQSDVESTHDDMSERGEITHTPELLNLLQQLNVDSKKKTVSDTRPSNIYTPDPTVYLTGPKSSASALDICDFVNITEPTNIDIGTCSGPDEVLQKYYSAKAGARRPKLHDVTISQWGLANARIMDKLFFATNSGDMARARLYLAYTAKVHELFNKFDRCSVLEYDRIYRTYQAAHQFEWGVDLPHLDTMTLKVNSLSKKPSTRSNDGGQAPDGKRSNPAKPLCRMYNSVQGCKFGERCSFQHKCSSCGDGHPAFIHSPPPQQSVATPKSTPAGRQ